MFNSGMKSIKLFQLKFKTELAYFITDYTYYKITTLPQTYFIQIGFKLQGLDNKN